MSYMIHLIIKKKVTVELVDIVDDVDDDDENDDNDDDYYYIDISISY